MRSKGERDGVRNKKKGKGKERESKKNVEKVMVIRRKID